MSGDDAILVLNAGSSSLKFRLFALDDALTLYCKGQVENITTAPHFMASDADGNGVADDALSDQAGHEEALQHLLAWIETRLGVSGRRLQAVGHRIVHGGRAYTQSVLVDDAVYQTLQALIPLAPLHQPHNLRAVEALRSLHPALPNIACFDTAFHVTHPPIIDRFGLPRSYEEEGIQRYGFHGLSYEYIAGVLPDYAGEKAHGRVIVAHLGNGASLCALSEGKAVDSTMGFSALDGLLMGTRCGSIDPGVLLYLLSEKQMTVDAVEQLLYRESGLKGVSGISHDMRTLQASSDPRAQEAIDLFCHQAAKQIAALTATLQGVDVLVFTAGIGEHSPSIRRDICVRLGWVGVMLEDAANEASAACISSPKSAVAVYTLPTNEERMIARHVKKTLQTI